MRPLGSVFFVLSLVFLGCGEKAAPPPPAAEAPAATALSPQAKCKKTFATNCANPCQDRAAATEKDPNRLRTLKNQCMIGCLEQAETACKGVTR